MIKKENLKTMGVGIGAFILIFVIAYGIYGVLVSSIDSHTATTQMNSTVSTTQMAFSVGTTLLTVVIIFGLFIGMWYIVSSQLRYQRFAKIVEFLAVSLYYFCFGLIALGIALIPIVLAYFTYNYAIEGNNFLSLLDMMKWIGVAVGAYFGLSLVGYLFKKKILDKRKQRQKEVEIEEEVITQ